MTPQEKDLITTLLERLKGAAGQPKDPEAEALIRQAMAAQPDAPYYLVQTVLIEDISLHNAQSRIAELERGLADAQAKPAPSFLGGLFGRGQPVPAQPGSGSVPSAGPWGQSAPPPQPSAPPAFAQPGYGQAPGGGMGSVFGAGAGGGGGGFLRQAATTAAGIAGGALLFEGIQSLFGRGMGGGGFLGGGYTPGLGETVINNYYGDQGSGASGGDYAGSDFDPGTGQNDDAGQDFDPGQDDGSDFGGGGDFSGGDSTC